jgi:anti-sigma regulatory factor (Ser/Thr protein kinase)
MFLPVLLSSVIEERGRGVEMEFAPEPESVARARRFVADALRQAEPSEDVGMRVTALVSELASNAVLHARTEFRVIVKPGRSSIRVAVKDSSPNKPVRKEYGILDPTGRGLVVVESMADRWGVEPADDGKVVWFEIDTGVRSG